MASKNENLAISLASILTDDENCSPEGQSDPGVEDGVSVHHTLQKHLYGVTSGLYVVHQRYLYFNVKIITSVSQFPKIVCSSSVLTEKKLAPSKGGSSLSVS